MRITLVTYDDEPPLGGQGTFVRGLRSALLARGIDVTTLAGRGPSAIRFPRVTGRAPLDLSLHLARQPRLMESGHPDVIHAQGGPGGVLVTRRLSRPLVYTAHHTYRQAHSRGSLRRSLSVVEARAYRRAAMVLAVSPSTAEAVAALGVPRHRIEVVPPGVVVPERLNPSRRVPGRMLFVGRQEPEKGVLEALEVMASVIARFPQASGRIVGSGTLAAAAREIAARHEHIEHLGTVSEPRLADEYAQAEIFIMPSRYEGLGLVALEAMAAGAVVVGYRVEGLRDAAAKGSVLVEPGDTAGLVSAATALLQDRNRLAHLAAVARSATIERHSWSAHAQRVEQIYRAVSAAG